MVESNLFNVFIPGQQQYTHQADASIIELYCVCVSMCFPLVLGLVWCLTRDHPSPPPVPPRSYTSFPASVKPKKVCCIQDLEVNAHCYDWLVYTEVAFEQFEAAE
ncbi:uncharacterized protein si:dkey-52l18.4 isoform X2 [Megalobrama amblycephala]|uniref:uncharacterized protein si:dkey-52l18.4 isoform X2 n=1 Tax=Megalobrama amblycephala TaxID=75352 RepID=UPI0020144975|nr:uncharacterized protein si:dkey-52l18.4 isoform X2 [Megalobrama amblycephala]